MPGDVLSVAVLGGGLAGLSAAFHTDRNVRIYQRGWRLGGKAASHRGANGRIEEHGLHVWLGYYDNAFALMRRVYDELDRASNDPACPIRTIEDAFFPASRVGVFDCHEGQWAPWIARFSSPGEMPGGESDAAQPGPADLVRRGAVLLTDLLESLGARPVVSQRWSGLELSGSPHRSAARPTGAGAADMIRRAEVGLMVGAVQMLNLLMRAPADLGATTLQRAATEQIGAVRDELRKRISRDRDARRVWEAADLVTSSLVGIYADRLLEAGRGFHSIDHLDFREWLVRHGATEETVQSGLVRGMYDLVFAYRAGDRSRPAFAAGTGLQLAGRFFFDHKGSLFWKMRAGMGETVVAPMYQALRRRGVDVAFFHRIERLRLDDAGRRVEAVDLVRQAALAPGVEHYEPLARFGDLPCFRARPDDGQLSEHDPGDDLEHHGAREPLGTRITLRRGVDFDDVVLAVSIGMVPHVCEELLAADSRWRDMVANIGTVATQAAQVWTRPDDAGLGWPVPGSTVSAFAPPFDTYASMPHLVEHEQWGDAAPGTVSYFCAALDDATAAGGDAAAAVRRNLEQFLAEHGSTVWPATHRRHGGGFDPSVLHGVDGRDPLDAQHVVANTDPSDRYVQSLPGSGRYRLAADESGFENLWLAGDWVDTGLNAGCIEAAVISGIQAANALAGRSIDAEVRGGWTPVRSARRDGA